LLDLLLKRKGLESTAAALVVRRAGIQCFPLSSAQERLWFLNQMDPHSAAYNIAGTFQIDGRFDIALFKESISQIVMRHDVLRYSFAAVNGEPAQSICPQRKVPTLVIDLSELSEKESGREVFRVSAAETNRPFDLTGSLLLRVTIVRLGERSHVAILAMHHIASDGRSIDIFMRELAMLYESGSSGKTCSLPELPYQYGDFAVWQKSRLKETHMDSQIRYWKQKLAGASKDLKLPFDRARPPLPSDRGAKQPFQFTASVTAALNKLGRAQGATMFMTLLSLFYALLYSYTREEDISVGTPATNRDRPGADLLIGLFVNTLVLRVGLSPGLTFRELVARVRETSLEAVANQDIPFERVVKTVEPDRDLSRSPLFQVWFMFDQSSSTEFCLTGATLRLLETADKSVRHDLRLAFEFENEGQSLKGAFEYRSELFDAATIELMISNLSAIALRVIELPEITLAELAGMVEEANRLQKADRDRQYKEASLLSLKNVRRKPLTAHQQTN
jgi:Condensation domain